MRILFTTSPLIGHLRPMLPLIRAAGAAGHEVVVATGPDLIRELQRRGVQTWSVGPAAADIVAARQARPPAVDAPAQLPPVGVADVRAAGRRSGPRPAAPGQPLVPRPGGPRDHRGGRRRGRGADRRVRDRGGPDRGGRCRRGPAAPAHGRAGRHPAHPRPAPRHRRGTLPRPSGTGLGAGPADHLRRRTPPPARAGRAAGPAAAAVPPFRRPDHGAAEPRPARRTRGDPARCAGRAPRVRTQRAAGDRARPRPDQLSASRRGTSPSRR